MEIYFLYELRHTCNIESFEYVSNKMKLNVDSVSELYFSDIHGSNVVKGINDSTFKFRFKELLKKQELDDEKFEQIAFRNEELIYDLCVKRKEFANLGTNKVKRRLNKLKDSISIALRLALEIEDVNIQAKKASRYYKNKIYDKKNALILKLVDVFNEQGWNYGLQNDNSNTRHDTVIFFEIPSCEQISWHFNYDIELKDYDGVWDGKINSTLDKLEECIAEVLKTNKLDK